MIKTLAINKQPDGENWFVRLTVKKGGQQQANMGVALSKQEFQTLQILSRVRVMLVLPMLT